MTRPDVARRLNDEPRMNDADPSDLEKKVEILARELGEAREQQTAISEMLRVISSSPGELEPVFQAVLANAVRICKANFGNLFLYEGNSFRIALQHNAPPAYAERWRQILYLWLMLIRTIHSPV